MTKHMPGPWRIAERETHLAITGMNDLGHDIPIAIIVHAGAVPDHANANANLLAAAPELLAALQAVLATDICKAYVPLRELEKLIIAAVTKALGGAQ